jgi:hypothetical protein
MVASSGPSGAVVVRLREAARRMDITPISPLSISESGEDGEWVDCEKFPRKLSLHVGNAAGENPRGAAARVSPVRGSDADHRVYHPRCGCEWILEPIGEVSEPPAVFPSRAPLAE